MPSSKAGGGGGKKQQPAEVIYNNIIEGDIDGIITDDEITPDSSPLATTASADEVFGFGGTDVIDGGDGDDIIHGGDDWDILAGGNGDDTIYGDAGDDFIFGDPGSDTISGGEGWDTVIYYGELDVDYSFSEITEIQGKGPNRTEVVVGYQITSLDDSGDVDTISLDVEEIVFITAPPGGTIVTQTDSATTQFDSAVTMDVLANDTILGMDPGVGLTITDIVDIQIDLGGGLQDLVPDGVDINYFSDADGGILNDGSILTLNADGTLTWDPNGVYDTKPAAGEPLPVIYFWYEASDGTNAAYGDVAIQVAYPAPTEGMIEFEDMQKDATYFAGLLPIYLSGPDDAFWITQLSTAGGGMMEERDPAAGGDFDYDNDGDDEYHVWTDADGTTHELNVTLANSNATFDVSSLLITDFDLGETVTVTFWSADGYTQIGDAIILDGVSGDGVYDISQTGIGQISIEAGAGDSVYIDDIVLA